MISHLYSFPPQAPFPTSLSFTQEVETALESFDFLNCSDLDEDEDEDGDEDEDEQQQEEKREQEEEIGQHENQNKTDAEIVEKEENFYSAGRSEFDFSST